MHSQKCFGLYGDLLFVMEKKFGFIFQVYEWEIFSNNGLKKIQFKFQKRKWRIIYCNHLLLLLSTQIFRSLHIEENSQKQKNKRKKGNLKYWN